jgi:hypothetical protein
VAIDYSQTAANRLYRGDVANLHEALELYVRALEQEIRDQESMEISPSDFVKEDLALAREALSQYKEEVLAAENRLIEKWRADPRFSDLGDIAKNQHWDALAV